MNKAIQFIEFLVNLENKGTDYYYSLNTKVDYSFYWITSVLLCIRVCVCVCVFLFLSNLFILQFR